MLGKYSIESGGYEYGAMHSEKGKAGPQNCVTNAAKTHASRGTTVSRAKPSASVTHANPLVALSTMGDKPAEGYYAGSLYTGIALVVIALLNIILYSVAVRTPTRPTFPTHMTPARAR